MKDKIFLLAIFIVTAVCCTPTNVDEIIAENQEVGITVNGKTYITYTAEGWQMAHNPTTNEYSVFNDDVTDYYVVRCNERPSSEGQSVTADVEYTTANNIVKITGITLEVKKVDKDKVWLYNVKRNILVVIKDLNN